MHESSVPHTQDGCHLKTIKTINRKTEKGIHHTRSSVGITLRRYGDHICRGGLQEETAPMGDEYEYSYPERPDYGKPWYVSKVSAEGRGGRTAAHILAGCSQGVSVCT